MGNTAPDRWDKDSKKYDRDKITMDWVLRNMQTELENTNKDLRKAEEETIKNDILKQLTPLRRTIQADNKDSIRTLWDGFYLRQKKGATDFLKKIDSNQEWKDKRSLCIIAVQTLLEAKGYFKDLANPKELITSRDRIDGIYKKKTHEAVLKFQQNYNKLLPGYNAKNPDKKLNPILADGLIGIQTIKALVTDLEANNKEEADANQKESNLQQKMLKDILAEIEDITPGEANKRLYQISQYDETTLHKEYPFGFDGMKAILEALCAKAHIVYDNYLKVYPNVKNYMDKLKGKKESEGTTTLDDRINKIKELPKDKAEAQLKEIGEYSKDKLAQEYPGQKGVEELQAILQALCNQAGRDYNAYLKGHPILQDYIKNLDNKNFSPTTTESSEGHDKEGSTETQKKVTIINQETINDTLKENEAKEIIKNINTQQSLTNVKNTISEPSLQELFRIANMDYKTRINQHEQLKNQLLMLELIKNATREKKTQQNTTTMIDNQKFQETISPIDLRNGFQEDTAYPHPKIQKLYQNTLNITKPYQEDTDDELWKTFNSFNSKRLEWLDNYQQSWRNKVEYLNSDQAKDLKDYISNFNQACNGGQYDKHGKHKDGKTVYFDNARFVKDNIIDVNGDTVTSKPIAATTKRTRINLLLSGKEVNDKNVKLVGHTIDKNSLMRSVKYLNNILTNNQDQWNVIANALISEQPIDLNTVLRGPKKTSTPTTNPIKFT